MEETSLEKLCWALDKIVVQYGYNAISKIELIAETEYGTKTKTNYERQFNY